MPTPFRTLLFALAALLLGVDSAWAHSSDFTRANVAVEADGRFTLTLNLDLLALAAEMPAEDATIEVVQPLLDEPRETLARRLAEASERLSQEVILRTDRGEATITKWTAPDLAEIKRALASPKGTTTPLPWIGEITGTGRLPAGTTRVSLRVAYIVGSIMAVFDLPKAEVYCEPVEAGEFSSTLPVTLTATAQPPSKVDPAVAAVSAEPVAPRPGRLRLFGRYIVIGFEHIIPKGLDHILFVLGLFLLSAKLKPLLLQISAFTLAHSLTLGLSLYGVVRLPSAVVEPLIAASIAFIAVENLFTSELKPWRPFVIFGFGLVHGLGFAGALAQVGLPKDDYALGLVAFNIGVEGGQLAVIATALLAVGWCRRRPWYRRYVVIPASTGIALIALVWTYQRIFPSA